MYVVHADSTEFTEVLAQVRPLSLFQGGGGGYVTIGAFDGVHRGHQQLIAEMVKAAHSTHNVAIVLTFDPHPATALGYEPPPPVLTTAEECAELLAALGIDALVALPFTPATARVQAADFIEALIHHLHLTELWGGPDFALGHRREGDIHFLRRLGAERGFAVHMVEPLMWGGALVSSSRVRAALHAGDIFQATGCLGRPYRLAGVVTHSPWKGCHRPRHAAGGLSEQGEGGDHNAEAPAARISPPPGRLIPADGVYACLAHTEHLGTHPVVVNVATRPTFTSREMPSGGQEPIIEAHLLDFVADLSDQVLALDFITRLRDERAFPTRNELVAQVHDGVARARNILARRET